MTHLIALVATMNAKLDMAALHLLTIPMPHMIVFCIVEGLTPKAMADRTQNATSCRWVVVFIAINIIPTYSAYFIAQHITFLHII